MGWFTDAKNWVQGLWEHETTTAVTTYLYNTAVYTFEQLGAVPKVAHSLVLHPATNKVAKHLLYITVSDLLPLMLVNYANQLIQDRGETYLASEESLSTQTAIKAALHLLQAATWIYRIRKQTELTLHMAIVTIEAPMMVNSVRSLPPPATCIDCTTLRYAKGSVRDLVAYFATEWMISLIGYTPGVGGQLAALLAVYHNGRYLTTVAMEGTCNRHHVVYLTEYPELALSLGLTHAASSALVSTAIARTTGIPAALYAQTISQLMLILQMSWAAHMTFPVAPRTSTRRSLDPVGSYQWGIGVAVDTVLLGLKTQIPRMLKGKAPGGFTAAVRGLPWASINEGRRQILGHPLTPLFLPPALYDLEAFVRDPLIQSNWPVVQSALVKAMKTVESLRSNPVIRVSSSVPGASSALVEAFFGTPKFVTKLLLQLLTDEEIHKFVTACRIEIQILGSETPSAERDRLMLESYEIVESEAALATSARLTGDSSSETRRARRPSPLDLPATEFSGGARTATMRPTTATAANPHRFFPLHSPAPLATAPAVAAATVIDESGWIVVPGSASKGTRIGGV